MSGEVLTTASAITCQSKGVVTAAATHPLTVARASVLTAVDLAGLDVVGCQKPEQAPSTKCKKVVPPVAGPATRLTVNNVPVLTTTGFTAATGGFGPPVPNPPVPGDPPESPGPGKLRAAANQTWLKGA